MGVTKAERSGKATGGLVEPMRMCLKLALRPLDRGQKTHRHCILPEISFPYFLPWHMLRAQFCVNSSAKPSSDPQGPNTCLLINDI